MNVGLDLGSHAFRALWQQDDGLKARRCRTTYVVVPDTPVQLRLIERLNVPYFRCDGGLVLLSDAADECAELLQVTPSRFLAEGALPKEDPLGRQMLAACVEHLIPQAASGAQSRCGFSCPSGKSQREFLSQVIRLKGYQPLPISAGHALILAELVEQAFTGVGLTLGATHCEFSLAFQGIEQTSGFIHLGGDWIDEEFARRTDAFRWDAAGMKLLDLRAAKAVREELNGSLSTANGRRENVLRELYVELIDAVCGEMARVLSRTTFAGSHVPLTLACCGGISQLPGFREMLSSRLQQPGFPCSIRELRCANASPYHVARGCLIHAELETRSMQTARAA